MTEFEQEQMQVAIGPRAGYYLEKFEQIERGGGKWVATWNWPAFFLSCAWFAYRRMSNHSLLNFFLPFPFFLLMLSTNTLGFLIMAAYLALVFVAIPMYANLFYYRHLKAKIAGATSSAGTKNAKKPPRPPSIGTGIEAALTAALAIVVPTIFLIVPAGYADYVPRAKVAEGVSLAVTLKSPIAEFFQEHKRFPALQEAEKFRIAAGKYTQSVVYDTEKRMIVVTMGQEDQKDYLRGKRFAIHAEEKDGTIFWTCRTIDLEQKYLPSACRN